jgi:hypothetical protein
VVAAYEPSAEGQGLEYWTGSAWRACATRKPIANARHDPRGWDHELLRQELQALESEGFDLDLAGFKVCEDDPVESRNWAISTASAD